MVLETLSDLISKVQAAEHGNMKVDEETSKLFIQVLSSCNPDLDSDQWKLYWLEAVKTGAKQIVNQLEYALYHLDVFPHENYHRQNVTLAVIHALDVLARNSPKHEVARLLVTPKKKQKLADKIGDLMHVYGNSSTIQTRLQMLFTATFLIQQVEVSGMDRVVAQVYKYLENYPDDVYLQRTSLLLLATARKAYKVETIIKDLVKGLNVIINLHKEGKFDAIPQLADFAKEFIEDMQKQSAAMKEDL